MNVDYTINIKNVDSKAKLDLDYVIDKYLRSIDGLHDTGYGKGSYSKISTKELNFIVKRI